MARATASGPWLRRRARLYEQLCEVVDDFGLLSYAPLSSTDPASVAALLLEQHVEASQCVLVFLSKGYFFSTNVSGG